MEESQEPTSGWKRTKDVFNGARVTVEVATHVLNPLYGPVAQHVHLEPVANQQQIVRQIDEREIHEEAERELMNLEKQAGQLVRTEDPARQDKSRNRHPGR